jgi:hypothetical protein
MTVSPLLFWFLCAFSLVCSCVLAVFVGAWIAQSRVIANQRAELNRVRGLLDIQKQHSRPTMGHIHKVRLEGAP